MHRFINIDDNVDKAIKYILENYEDEPGEEPSTYDSLVNLYLKYYIENFFVNGQDILYR